MTTNRISSARIDDGSGAQGLGPLEEQLAAAGRDLLNYEPIDVLSTYSEFCAGTQANFQRFMDAYVQSIANQPQMTFTPAMPQEAGPTGPGPEALGTIAQAISVLSQPELVPVPVPVEEPVEALPTETDEVEETEETDEAEVSTAETSVEVAGTIVQDAQSIVGEIINEPIITESIEFAATFDRGVGV